MKKYAILCGSAPEDYRQKKLVEKHNYLTSKEGGSLLEKNIVLFPNGTNELLLETVLNNLVDEEATDVLIYFCTDKAIDTKAETFFLGKDEFRKDVLEYYKKTYTDTKYEILFDTCIDYISENELGFEKV